MLRILVLYYSESGNTLNMARQVVRGVNAEAGAEAVLRSAPPLSAVDAAPLAAVPEAGAPYVSAQDLAEAQGLILGSPSWYGLPAAPLKAVLDQSTPLWLSGSLIGRPAGVFCSSGSLHGGQEACLLAMMVPLLHHGMILCGLPYDDQALMKTDAGGTPYGASHYAGADGQRPMDEIETHLCQALGARVARVALALAAMQS